LGGEKGGMGIKFTRRIAAQERVSIPKKVINALKIGKGDLVVLELTHKDKTAFLTVSLYAKRQVHLPEAVRDSLGVGEGDIIDVEIKDVVKEKSEGR